MPRTRRRSGWQQKNGKWTRTIGEGRGAQVRLFQKKKDGSFHRDVYLRGGGRDRKCLDTRDRDEAERLGRQFLDAWLKNERELHSGTVTLGGLWERYSRECVTFLDNHPGTRRSDETRAAILLAHFGADCDVRDLTPTDQDAYTARRLAGGISYVLAGARRVTRKVRPRSVECDLKLLHSMLKWATTVRVGRRGRLLDRHPLDGVKGPKQLPPRRELATWERFEATRAALTELAAANPERASTYAMVDFALVLAEAQGRRQRAIRYLRFEDVDFAANQIVWPAETDKKGKKWVQAMREGLADEIKEYRARMQIGFGFMFPDLADPSKPLSRHVFRDCLEKAEKHAGLAKLDGTLWHAYRRTWGTVRKHLPLVDVAAAGGWSDTSTLLKCYQQPDQETMLAVVNEPRKLRVRVAAG